MCEVFEDVLKTLGLVDRQDILTTMIARKLVELAKAGVRDPVRLKQMTLRTFRKESRVKPVLLSERGQGPLPMVICFFDHDI